MEDLGIYVHIPFCKSKCYYCDFNSYSNKEYLQDEYISCLIKEIEIRESIIKSYNIKSIYIGGGTPTYLNSPALKKLLLYLKRFVNDKIEYSCEANPGTLTKEKLEILKENGVNRLSIGLQSWNNDILRNLGRIHNLQDFIDNYKMARAVGFDNINVDLMFAIQGQTVEDASDTIDNVIALKPEHISCYSLIIEEGTKLFEQYKCGQAAEVDEEIDRLMYYTATDKLEKMGYKRYEISNYAREGYECTHNIIYWRTKPYLGVGAGAHSYIENCRFSNETNPEKYIARLKDLILPILSEEKLSIDDKISEFMFMGLRMTEGVVLSEFKNRFGMELLKVFGKEIERLRETGLVKLRDEKLMLTDLGIDLSNQVFVEFLK